MNGVISMIKRFLETGDFSLASAQVLEGELDRALLEEFNEDVETLKDVLASYRRGGGEFLYNQAFLERALRKALRGLAPDGGGA